MTGCTGTTENGVLVWGQLPGATMPAQFTAPCGTTISAGAVTNNVLGRNQITSFTKGKPPAIRTGVNWGSSNSFTVSHPAPVHVGVKFWALYIDPLCNLSCVQTNLNNWLSWANAMLSREGAGIVLTASSTGLVTDKTGVANTKPKVRKYKNMKETQAYCGKRPISKLASLIKESNAFNVYIVQTVKDENARGTSCYQYDMAFVAHQSIWGTILHEIGHNLYLYHPDDSAVAPFFNAKNLMWSDSPDRDYLSEGQTFRMHFSQESALVKKFGFRELEKRDCLDEGTDDNKPCPKYEKFIWPDP